MHNCSNKAQITVLYDGGCPLCAKEIAHYRRQDKLGRVNWQDISKVQHPWPFAISRQSALLYLHVQDQQGQWQVGVMAFIAIWQQLPSYRWLAKLASVQPLKRLLSVCYRSFAKCRYRRRCSDGCSID